MQEAALKRRTRRARPLAGLMLVVAALVAPTSGCFGPFKAVNAVYELNQEPQDKWLEEAVFLCFTLLLPVYELAILIDVLILNPIDFFDQ
jgi:hypothetical protein